MISIHTHPSLLHIERRAGSPPAMLLIRVVECRVVYQAEPEGQPLANRKEGRIRIETLDGVLELVYSEEPQQDVIDETVMVLSCAIRSLRLRGYLRRVSADVATGSEMERMISAALDPAPA